MWQVRVWKQDFHPLRLPRPGHKQEPGTAQPIPSQGSAAIRQCCYKAARNTPACRLRACGSGERLVNVTGGISSCCFHFHKHVVPLDGLVGAHEGIVGRLCRADNNRWPFRLHPTARARGRSGWVRQAGARAMWLACCCCHACAYTRTRQTGAVLRTRLRRGELRRWVYAAVPPLQPPSTYVAGRYLLVVFKLLRRISLKAVVRGICNVTGRAWQRTGWKRAALAPGLAAAAGLSLASRPAVHIAQAGGQLAHKHPVLSLKPKVFVSFTVTVMVTSFPCLSAVGPDFTVGVSCRTGRMGSPASGRGVDMLSRPTGRNATGNARAAGSGWHGVAACPQAHVSEGSECSPAAACRCCSSTALVLFGHERRCSSRIAEHRAFELPCTCVCRAKRTGFQEVWAPRSVELSACRHLLSCWSTSIQARCALDECLQAQCRPPGAHPALQEPAMNG